ncbi:UNVERIFIED_CONTAM: hypothetical protein K2H54_005243 [Gekko kuhli]
MLGEETKKMVSTGEGGSLAVESTVSALEDRQETLQVSMAELVAQNQAALKSIVEKCTENMQAIINQMIQNTKETAELRKNTEKTARNIKEIEMETVTPELRQEDLEQDLIALQVEGTASTLRFQNVPEEKQEATMEKMAKLLTRHWDLGTDARRKATDQTSRMNPANARHTKVPGEAQTLLFRRMIWDKMLKEANPKIIEVDGEVNNRLRLPLRLSLGTVLEEIPWSKRRKKRRKDRLMR